MLISKSPLSFTLRGAEPADLSAISALDQRITGVGKRAWWQSQISHYAGGPPERFFLVIEGDGRFAGFAMGEIRAWEFGSPPCGWIFAIQIDPSLRERRAGTMLFEALCARFREQGVARVRTLVDRKDLQILSFFRAQGMRAGPSLQLDLDLKAGAT